MTRWQALFADLEARTAALATNERAAEIEDRIREEASRLTLVDRLRAQVGSAIRAQCAGGTTVAGRIAHVGREWLLIDESSGRQAVVMLAAVHAISQVGRLAAAPGSMSPVESRLGADHVLRAVIRDRAVLRVYLKDGSVLDGTLDRLGSDYVELASHPAGELRRRGSVQETVLLSTASLAVLRRDS